MLRWYSQWIASRFGWVTNIGHRTLAPIEFAQSHLSRSTSLQVEEGNFIALAGFTFNFIPICLSHYCPGDEQRLPCIQVGHAGDLSDFQSFCLRLLFLESWMMYCTWR